MDRTPVALVLALTACNLLSREPASAPAPPAPAPVAVEAPAPAAAEPTIQGLPASSLPDVAERVVQSVVSVSTRRVVPVGAGMDPMMRRFLQIPDHDRVEQGAGSGVLLDREGVILTNHHVVEDADEVTIELHDGRRLEAKVVGADPKTDVAVVRLVDPPDDLVPIEVGDSDTVRLGQVVLAVGNPFNVGETVTMGIVSALGRNNLNLTDYEDFIQTDAAINPGNSGGALVDLDGRLVGVNSAIYSRTGGSMGIGFAIPSNLAVGVARSILEKGRVERGWLGVAIQDLDPEIAAAMAVEGDGVLISDVQRGTPAERAGFQPGDVVVELDGKPVKEAARFRYTIAAEGPGHAFEAVVLRDGERVTLRGELGTLPGEAGVVAGAPEADDVAGGATFEPLSDRVRERHQLPGRLEGLLVRSVEPGSPLDAAGLAAGDILLDVNRRAVGSPQEFARAWRAASGGRLLLRVYRGGDVRFLVANVP